MNRRSFLRLGLGAGAALALGLRLTPAPQINPAWHTATYEIDYLFNQHALRLLGQVAAMTAQRSPWTEVIEGGTYARL